MAPEVGLQKPYNESCDVYSFALLFWQMMTFKKPYRNCNIRSLHTEIWSGPEERPQLTDDWEISLKLMLSKAWSSSIAKRPSMREIESTLRDEILRCNRRAYVRMSHAQRRSTFQKLSFRDASFTSRMTSTRSLLSRGISTRSMLSRGTSTRSIISNTRSSGLRSSDGSG